VVTSDSTNTFTNKTFNVESAGNAITLLWRAQFPSCVINNATTGSAWNLPTSSAPTVNARTGTNIQECTLDFADGDSAQPMSFILPPGLTGTIDADIVFFSPDTSGTVIFNIQTACPATSGSTNDDIAFNTADAFATITLNATSNAVWRASKATINITGCDPNDMMQMKISRATDTATSRARVKTVRLIGRTID
jgi:hypothetical protein